jgi:hypothetical protein
MTTTLRQLADLLEDGADISDVPLPVLRRGAAALRLVPDVSVAELQVERDAAIVECLRLFYWDSRSRRSAIMAFLHDVGLYRDGRWRRDQDSIACPELIRGKREGLFWRVLRPGLPVPDLRQVENVVAKAARKSAK